MIIVVNQKDYNEFKALPQESNLVKCERCGRTVYEDDAIAMTDGDGGFDSWLCCDCEEKERREWVDYFNRHGVPSHGTMTEIEVVEILDVVDPPYCADAAIEFTCNGKRYSACATVMTDGCGGWEYDPNGDITEIEEITDDK